MSKKNPDLNHENVFLNSPESPEIVPRPVDIPAPTSVLSLRIAREQRLDREFRLALTFDGEPKTRERTTSKHHICVRVVRVVDISWHVCPPVRGHGGGGEGPGGPAPTLVPDVLDLPGPLVSGVEKRREILLVVAELDG